MSNRKSILLVEDEALIAMNQTMVLKRNGFSVETAHSGEDAVEAALNKDFDLVLMDIDLGHGKMDGTKAAEKILGSKELPIVFCTSHTEKDIVEKVKGITRYGYIIKNTGEFVLIESINMALELFEAHCQLKKENANRIKAEKESKLSSAFYRQIMENNIDAVYLMNRVGEIIEVNNVACEKLGYSKEEFSRMTIDDVDINYPSEKFIEFWNEKPEGASIIFDSIHRHKTSRHIPVEIHGIFFLHEGAKYLFGIAREISEHYKIEKELHKNELLLKQITENFPDSYLSIVEKDFTIGYTAGQEFQKVGLNPQDFVGLKLEDVFGEQADFVRSEYEKAFEGETRSFELYINSQYQQYRTVPLFDQDGSVGRILSVVRNITEQKIDEIKRKEIQERCIKAQRLGNVGNWEYNIKTGEFWGSDQAKRIYGFKPEDSSFTTDEVESCIPERERVHQALVDLIDEKKEYNLEFDIIPYGSEERKTIVSIAELEKDVDGNPYKVTGVIHDVTEFKKLLEQKEILLKELSHRVKNNLFMVSSLIAFEQEDLGDCADLSGLKGQVEAIMKTYDAIYQTDDLSKIHTEDYLNNILNNLFRQSPYNVNSNVNSEVQNITSNSAVLLGLIVNEAAVNAVKHGFKGISEPKFDIKIQNKADQNAVNIIISNNGLPIDESVVIENSGTLGLKLISELTVQMQGSIDIQKAPNPVFSIRLPSSVLES